MITQVPELADGGYWYVVPEAVPDDGPGRTVGADVGVGWCAWYADGQHVVIRTADPAPALLEMGVSAANALGSRPAKPYGRIRGR